MKQTLYTILPASILLFGCTYNISMVHTNGTAQDVIDTEQEAKPDIKTEVNVTPTGL